MTVEQPKHLLLIEDDASLSALLQEELSLDGHEVLAAGTVTEGATLATQQCPDLVISDVRLPDGDGLSILKRLQAAGRDVPFIIITAFGTVDQAVDALQAGADDFLTKPLSVDHLRLKVKRLLAQAELNQELAHYRSVSSEASQLGLMGDSPAMDLLRKELRLVARSDASVLINGESGTSKELVARAIHRESNRRDGPFVPVNCAGIPAELMESEFFGHEQGAFTGATQSRKGLFPEASGGTLFLDEIGEMPLPLQAKLLRVLQERRVKPVGAEREEPVDVRILAATHIDLLEAVSRGDFREDLYFRLETLMLTVPPLRDRGDDVELLAMHFLSQSANRHKRGWLKLSEATAQVLMDYPFPGNVRELASAMERAATFCHGDVVRPEHLPARIRKRQLSAPTAVDQQQGDQPIAHWPTLETLQKRYVGQVMTAVGENKRRAAQILGINRRTLYRWLDAQDGYK
ncbi:sigma-54-dependent transcriptional regulator [Marinobacter sp. R17]|uniref:sigma-54-dependent transcriptional regulator n=1 Tax=Marinobacter sp. R17 TaxID=2484250 RepID=UPI00398A3C8E